MLGFLMGASKLKNAISGISPTSGSTAYAKQTIEICIANYIASVTNCVSSSSLYSICCIGPRHGKQRKDIQSDQSMPHEWSQSRPGEETLRGAIAFRVTPSVQAAQSLPCDAFHVLPSL